jgi:hypothetical protein
MLRRTPAGPQPSPRHIRTRVATPLGPRAPRAHEMMARRLRLSSRARCEFASPPSPGPYAPR